MVCQLIDGRSQAQILRQKLKADIEQLKQHHRLIPKLTVIMVGDHPASQIYVRNKLKACDEVGIESGLVQLPATISSNDLCRTIKMFNNDDCVHGILLQLPLPSHINTDLAVETIAPAKDVDGLHPYNQGLLLQGQPRFVPCTPQGCLQLIQSCCSSIEGLNAVVVGRSILVGRPMATLLLNANVTVTIAHSYTTNLEQVCRQADIIVAAMGKPRFITADYVKPGAIIIDVGINRLGENTLVGDVDFETVRMVAGYVTPVPGGVGPMTVANLLYNTVKAAQVRL